jgi:hypothetical protein
MMSFQSHLDVQSFDREVPSFAEAVKPSITASTISAMGHTEPHALIMLGGTRTITCRTRKTTLCRLRRAAMPRVLPLAYKLKPRHKPHSTTTASSVHPRLTSLSPIYRDVRNLRQSS